MIQLDLLKLNKISPYKVFPSSRKGYYGFVSKSGVEFAIGFELDDFISSDSYQLIIVNANHKASPRDKYVRDTIFAIVSEFFRLNNVTMLYICESGDSKQAMRSRLFTYWFSEFIDKGKYTLLQSSIVDDEGIDNFFAIISRNDNPNLKNVISEFYDNVMFFSQKPE